MTAALQIAASILSIPLDLIDPSPTNPRKTFTDVEELAGDFKLRGVLVPLIVRPAGKRYECVDGERRLRAAKIAKLATVPGQVRELSDLEVLEIQIVSQAKRADIHPVEEAEAYRMLRDVHHLSVEEIAAKVGRPKGTVYERLKLCELAPEVRKAALAGELPASHAVLIARIPDKKLQVEALAKVLDGGFDGEIFTYREAIDLIHRDYMLQLADVQWDLTDEKLVPAAGSCTKCSKRTGNQPELFADVKAKDTCTDPACFEQKKKAWVQLRIRKAEADGNALRSATEAQKSLKSGDFVDLDQRGWIDGEHTTLREKLGKKAEQLSTAVAASKDGLAVQELASKAEVDKLLGREREEKKRAEREAQDKRDQEKANAETKLRRAVADAMLVAIAGKVQARDKLGKPFWYVLANAACDRFNPDDEVLVRHLGKALNEESADYGQITAKMNEGQLRALTVELLLGESLWEFRRGEGGPISEIARILGVDEKKVKAEVKAAARPVEPKPKQGKKK